MASQGEYGGSVQKCLLNADQKGYIQADIKRLQEQIEQRNQIMEGIQETVGPADEGFLTETYNTDKIEEEYLKSSDFTSVYNQNPSIKLKDGTTKKLQDIVPQNQLSNLNIEEMKDIVTYSNVLNQGDSENSASYDVAESKLGDLMYNVNQRMSIVRETDNLKSSFSGSGIGAVASSFGDKKTLVQEMSPVNGETVGLGKESTQAFLLYIPETENIDIAGQNIKVGLKLSGEKYIINKAVNENGGDVTQSVEQYYSKISSFEKASPDLYDNAMKGEAKVKYYESAPYTDLPAQVPFDKKNGWYVGTDYILSGFGKPYEESGRAINFWICNVGENGLIEFKQGDECRYYNRGTNQELDFPGLSKTESAKIVKNAETAIVQASQQHGQKEVVILNQVFEAEGAGNGEAGQCTDFMSPSDCNLMFNVCDPVMCPESRCDYGGQYRVSNVVQSGIIGSLLLCLPNANEGIAIPVCLTGVHAGIEGYLSILKSTQSCLQESLDTGQNIGICDEIKSVYMCEFFWRQAVPLMDVFIPRVFSAFFGQNIHGGGEYMTVNYAWENAKKSVDYFKNEYAVNAMKAFNSRSTAEIGGDVCKAFIGARYPDSKDFFDNLVKPDSPVQYHAWFSENILTEATIPATSHYKVYYHIYAGKDRGANYVVYLKNPPDSAYVNTLATYVVDRGYVKKGEQVDEAKDFTGVAGYQELCVNVNGQEECGFKQVSTSWALDQVANQYAAEQATDGVKTTQECVAGSPSLWSFAQPNLQAGAQEAISPELYKRGIIRVCSSDNPGSAENSGELDRTNSTHDRWKKVGYCDTESIGCWIDTQSVKDVLADAPNLSAEVLDQIDVNYLGEPEIMTPGQVDDVFKEADSFVKSGLATSQLTKSNIDAEVNPLINALIKITESGGLNTNKARAFLFVGKIYDLVASEVYASVVQKAKAGSGGSDVSVESVNQDEKDNFAIGTRVKDLTGDVWTKTGEGVWESESGMGIYSLSDIPYRPITLISEGASSEKLIDAEITEIKHWIEDNKLTSDEFYVNVLIKNNGEEGDFAAILYNEKGELVERDSVSNLESGGKTVIRLDTGGLNVHSINDMGSFYTVVLYDNSDPTNLIKLDSEKRYIPTSEEARKELYADGGEGSVVAESSEETEIKSNLILGSENPGVSNKLTESSDVDEYDLFKYGNYYLGFDIKDGKWKYKVSLSENEWKIINIEDLDALINPNFKAGIQKLAETNRAAYYKDYFQN